MISNANCDISCTNCLKRKDSLFDGLSQKELSKLDSRRSLVTFTKEETIYREGSKSVGLLCLSQGKVKVVKRGSHNSDQIIELKKPVDFLGLKTLLGEQVYTDSAIALEACEVCIINKADFFEVWERNNAMSMRIIRNLSAELERSAERVISLTQSHLEGRLAETLLHVMDVFGTAKHDKRLINAQLKRSDIASLSNMTTANAIRTLSKFAKRGLISLNKRKIKIIEIDTLREICFHA